MSVITFDSDRPTVPNQRPEHWDGKIAFVGEAPGEKEVAFRKPFMGPAGSMFERLLQNAGLSRSRVYIGNVCQHRPPRNDLAPWCKATHADHWRVEEGIEKLKAELEELQPNVILALGETALNVLTDKKGITNWRGSRLPCTLVPGLKVVPTYHPAAILRQYSFATIALADLNYAIKHSEDKTLIFPEREINIVTDYDQAVQVLRDYREKPEWSFDIETTPLGGWQTLCIGFAPSKDLCHVIPFVGPQALCEDPDNFSIFNHGHEVVVRQELRKTLQNDSRKCGQNGMYDRFVLAKLDNIMVLNYTDDTMLANKLMYPEFPMGLGFLTSIWTDHNFYKDEGKVWKQPNKATFDLWWQFFEYNGKDCMVTQEVREKQLAEMARRGILDVYRDVMELQDPLLYMNLKGLHLDYMKQMSHEIKYTRGVKNLEYILEGVLGRTVNVKSPKQMKELLYDKELGMGLPPVKVKGVVSTAEDALVKLSQKTNDPLFTLFMGLRKERTKLSDVKKVTCDPDGVVRYMLNSTTSTGRLGCKGGPLSTGTNMQNMTKDLRDIIIPPPKKDLNYSDLARAEAKVVAYLCRDIEMIKMFDDPDFDVHTANASRIFGKPEADISYDERYLAKRVVHASNYGMGPRKMAMIISADGFPTTERQCKEIQRKYFAAFPSVVMWQKRIQNKLYKTRTITTATGRSRFFNGRMNDDTFREAYAFEPQEIVAWVMAQGIKRVFNYMGTTDNPFNIDMHLQVHDAIVWSCDEGKFEEAKAVVQELLTNPIMIEGRECVIAVDHTTGKNWKECS